MFKIFLIILMLNLFSALPLKAQECMSMHVVLNTAAGYIDKTGKIAGYHYDFLTALEKTSGICMDKHLLPHSRAKRNIQIGTYDGGILARSNDLDPYVEYITKILTSKMVIIPKKGVVLNSVQDLSNIRIAKIRSVDVSHVLSAETNISFVDVAGYEQGLKMLKRGRVDAILGNDLGIGIIIKKFNMLQELNLSEKLIIKEREVWFVLSKESKHINKVNQLREAAQTLIDKGILSNILNEYF